MKIKILFCTFSSIILFIPGICLGQMDSQKMPSASDTIFVKQLQEIVLLANKRKQALLYAPVTIQSLKPSFFKVHAAATFFDALESVQGIQMITPSLGFRVINARGFANTTNVRFSQLVDGMDVQSPHIGAPIGNALGPTDLDIKRVEIIPGVASSLYGVNAVNGLANFETLTPFEKSGLSFKQLMGINHLNDANTAAKLFSETSIRYAAVIKKKFGYKFNISATKGYDWIADNYSDLNANANSSTNLVGMNNPAMDPVNSYGNESSNRKTIQLQGKSYVVARTGYKELDVANYQLQNFKLNLSLYYRFTNKSLLSFIYQSANLNNIYQRANRFVLSNYVINQFGLQYQSDVFHVKVYTNTENTGDSYNMRSLAENIDKAYKSDATWFADYSTQFNQAYQSGSNIPMAHQLARNLSDIGRFQPGSDSFNHIKSKLQKVNNWDSGAALKVVAKLLHAEAQFDIGKWMNKKIAEKGFDAIFGIDSRTYFITPDGNYFRNPIPGKDGKDIVYSKFGTYLSVNQRINAFSVGLSFRIDKNDYFSLKSIARASLLYAPNKIGSLRISFSNGFRFPSIFEAYSNINSGGVKRVGGLPIMSSGVYENGWLATSTSNFQSAVLNNINNNRLSLSQAIEKEKNLLHKSTYTYIQPEQIKSFELGYRSSLNNNQLILDIDCYFNNYNNFIAQTNINVPKTTAIDSIPFALNDKSKYDQYRIWTNSNSIVYNYGISMEASYLHSKSLTIALNGTYAQLHKTINYDGLEDGFNTPNWIVNASFVKKGIFKMLDVSLSYKWQSAYFTQTFLVTGTTKAYGVLDGNIAMMIPKYNLRFKLGSTNLLNQYYYSYLGGPNIGGLYYFSITY